MREPDRSVLNVYVAAPRALESDWLSLLRQIGFLSTACQQRGIALNSYKGCQTGFEWEALRSDGPCVCISLMDEADYGEAVRSEAVELLRREGVACVIALLRSKSDGVAQYEVDGAVLHIIRYSAPSGVRIAELPAIRRLLDGLAPRASELEVEAEDRVIQIHPGLIAARGLELYDLMQARPDVIVALDSLPGSVWEDFRGELLYYPIPPYGVLPFFILERLAVEVDGLLEDRKRVALYCGEDCGRVGYVAACVLFLRGVREPVDHLRQRWEASALSVKAQEDDVRLFCHRHVARTCWHCVQLTRHIQIDSIDAFKADEDIRGALRRVGESLGERSRIALRFSGLLPSVRIMVEAANAELCQRAIDDIVRVVDRKGHCLGNIDGW